MKKQISGKALETWLAQRGGRDATDLRVDEHGDKYVEMGDGNGGIKAVYIPILQISTKLSTGV